MSTESSAFTVSVTSVVQDTRKIEITTNNYANILKAVHNDLDSYIGKEIHFTGYVYRLLDFKDTEFVLARDMIIASDNQSLVIGFLCNYKSAKKFDTGSGVEVSGKIQKTGCGYRPIMVFTI